MSIDRKIMPPVRTVSQLNLTHPEKATLSNGIPVVIIPAGTEPVCRIDLVFEAGSRYQDTIFQSSLTNQMLPEGTATLTGAEIAGEFEFYGSYFNVSADRDEADLTLHCLEKHLEPALLLLSEVVIHPAFPEEELSIIKANRIESMKVDDHRVESLARKQFNRMIFGESHPYGVVGEIEDIDPINPLILKDFHHRLYQPPRCRILITGPRPHQYFPIVEHCFGQAWNPDHPAAARELPDLPPLQESKWGLSTVYRPDAVQTAIRMGKPVISRLDGNFMDLTIVNTILGGYFGSRLMANIREEKGYTYGISSHLLTLKESGYFVIGSTVTADLWRETVVECKKEINRLQNDRVGPAEMELVRNYLTGQVQRSVDGPFQIADQFRALWMHGLDLNYLTSFMERINTITPDEIRSLAGMYLDYSNMAIVAAGPVQSPD